MLQQQRLLGVAVEPAPPRVFTGSPCKFVEALGQYELVSNKGVFITTSTFTAQAVEFAKSVERVVLVDGTKLADLMIDFEVGVTMRPVRVPKLDTDYFEEE